MVQHRFLAAEENLVTPYEFGVYDLLVLPPSFPYGGMVSQVIESLHFILILGIGKCMLVILDSKFVENFILMY